MSEAENIVGQMMEKDAFSQWLGIEVLKVEPGYSKLQMVIRDAFVNGFNIAHGGITFSFADSALAFASNGHGTIAVSTNTSISHFAPVHIDDVLTAEAKELNISNKLGHYQVEVTNQKGERVAHFIGSVYRTSKRWKI
jgi:acyl-CoA thioesterase